MQFSYSHSYSCRVPSLGWLSAVFYLMTSEPFWQALMKLSSNILKCIVTITSQSFGRAVFRFLSTILRLSVQELRSGEKSTKKIKTKLRGLNLRANYTDLKTNEVSANFCGKRVPRGQRDGSLRPYSRIFLY
jgi:hypothetical protein